MVNETISFELREGIHWHEIVSVEIQGQAKGRDFQLVHC